MEADTGHCFGGDMSAYVALLRRLIFKKDENLKNRVLNVISINVNHY